MVVQAWDFARPRLFMGCSTPLRPPKRVVVVLSNYRMVHGEAEWRGFYADDPSGERDTLLRASA